MLITAWRARTRPTSAALQVFATYDKNVQRIVDAYTRAQKEVKADLQKKLAGRCGGGGGGTRSRGA